MANPTATIDFQAMWNKLKLWAARRHDYLEKQYKETNFSADAAELGAFRAVYQAMSDIEQQAMNGTLKPPSDPAGARPTRRGQ